MQIAIQVEAAFEIEECRHLAAAVDGLDGRGVERQLDHVLVFLNLLQRQLDHPERVRYFEAAGIVRLGRVDGKEHRVESPGARTGQVKVAVGITLADIGPLEKLPGHHVNMAIHHEGRSLAQNRSGARGENEDALGDVRHDSAKNSVLI